MDFATVKLRLIGSIAAIAAIQILETFVHIDEVRSQDAGWQLAILLGIGMVGVCWRWPTAERTPREELVPCRSASSSSPMSARRVKSARDYWQEALSLVALCDRYGYSHVRTVEHYFHPYGGYSPNPVVFLAAAAQVTKQRTPGHRRGAAGVQQSAEARRRTGDAGCAVRRPARYRLRARLPAA